MFLRSNGSNFLLENKKGERRLVKQLTTPEHITDFSNL